jgi:hypothetical protein
MRQTYCRVGEPSALWLENIVVLVEVSEDTHYNAQRGIKGTCDVQSLRLAWGSSNSVDNHYPSELRSR